ncbi:MAG: hypothetical protein H6Q11_928 [Acidobacteria bacterium]|nr:hypothetical protein [Acidobacteriota bacterium]
MARIPLVTDRTGLDERGAAVFDRIVESRGSLIPPFQVMLHVPDLAETVADVGRVIRFQAGLPPADRELVILAVGRALDCPFIWESHLLHARKAGVRPEAVAALAQAGPDVEQAGQSLEPLESALLALVGQLIHDAVVSDEVFQVLHGEFGTAGFVNLVVVVGYYTMLGFAMSACRAC